MDSGGSATQEVKAENRSLQGVNEDSKAELMYRTYCMLALQEQKPMTPLSRKKCIFRSALKIVILKHNQTTPDRTLIILIKRWQRILVFSNTR